MSAQHLFDSVIHGGFCVGCGACAALPGSGIAIIFTEMGMYRAELLPSETAGSTDIERLCPFSDLSIDEDSLGNVLFPAAMPHPQIGRHIATYAGSVAEGEYRAQGSSGGLVTWLGAKLLESGAVDGVAHIRTRELAGADDCIFAFVISRDLDALKAGAKSRYYPVEMSAILREIAERPGRYAVVGVPCFIKAIRLVQRQHPLFRDRIRFTIGLVCGHLKSAAFAQSLSWQMGVHPDSLRVIDFRHKLPDRPPNKYGVRVWSRDGGEPVTKPTSELFGCDWGLGLFKYRACDFCDDVLAETADVSVGDAWLPEYASDSRGTNIIVARTQEIADMLRDGIVSGALLLDPVSADRVAKSQTSGLRHRREGLAHRLWRCDSAGNWRPPKRVKPLRVSRIESRATIYELREKLGISSHSAFKKAKQVGDIDQLRVALEPLLVSYENAYRPGGLAKRLRRLARSLPSPLRRVLRRLMARRLISNSPV